MNEELNKMIELFLKSEYPPEGFSDDFERRYLFLDDEKTFQFSLDFEGMCSELWDSIVGEEYQDVYNEMVDACMNLEIGNKEYEFFLSKEEFYEKIKELYEKLKSI